MTGAVERIQVLEAIEKDIITCLQSAGKVCFQVPSQKIKISN